MGTLSAPTLAELIVNVRLMLRQQDPNNSTWSDQEIAAWLNEGVRLYFSEVIRNNEGHFTTQVDLDLVSGTDTVAMPADFFAIRALYKTVSDGYINLPYRNHVNESYNTQGGTTSNMYFPYYYFRDNSIVLRPVPNFSETSGLRLEYIRFPSTLINGGDSLTTQVSPVFKQLVEMYAVYKCKIGESLVSGVDTSALAKENLATLYESFKNSIEPRSKSPQAIQPFNPESEGY